MNFNSDDLKRLEALISAASPAPVEWGAITGKTIEQHVEDFRSSLSWDTAVGTDLHGVYLSGSETVVCHTGNGPHSEANARLITFAINNFPKIAEHLRAALQQLAPLSEAAEMIETLVPDSETGECQVCGAAAITRGRAHRDDCKAQQLVERLRGAANKTCAHPWERVGISGDGHPFCSQCRTNLVKDPPWPAANPTKPPHEREPPHCPTCDCGAANQTGERDA